MEQFKKIYSEYKHRVYFFVRKYVRQETDVEDIVQDIFVHLWKHLDKADSPSAVEAIIFKASKQEISNFYRRNKILFVSSEENIIPENADDISDEVSAQEQMKKVEVLLDKLPMKTKELLLRHTTQNISYSKLADEHKVSKTAIGKQINKALDFLKINLQ
ncbi:sigma-70 family RNA polymerase sigma factor [Chryseobacterium sp. Tr-659]|uniref:RNA polymerase sigma factor n=1 Tax=Chryseobacterium sp. Tr-659 TaxID=2608340 RepID=UPI00142498C6|nr:sigma-70 family RNA polymerase sigma factor [Chryseobacterium sp. Tr-659]NIF06530.1 sigma-70 family RNA polymerase sigma factor [Chryseobacterium sp. Tr-659]